MKRPKGSNYITNRIFGLIKRDSVSCLMIFEKTNTIEHCTKTQPRICAKCRFSPFLPKGLDKVFGEVFHSPTRVLPRKHPIYGKVFPTFHIVFHRSAMNFENCKEKNGNVAKSPISYFRLVIFTPNTTPKWGTFPKKCNLFWQKIPACGDWPFFFPRMKNFL